MIRLYQFPRFFGLPNASPFCVKVECWLRMTGIEYQNVWVTNPSKLPRGKAPVIEHDGRVIPDSTLIIEYLEKHFATHLDAQLNARERAAAHAFGRMLEERSYWVLVYSRWVDERGWPTLKQTFFGSMPPLVRDLVAAMMRRRVHTMLRGHGLGLHDAEAVYALGAADLQALSNWLADGAFLMGDEPSTVDATVYGFVVNALHSMQTPLSLAAHSHTNLAAYCERMRARYFPELPAH